MSLKNPWQVVFFFNKKVIAADVCPLQLPQFQRDLSAAAGTLVAAGLQRQLQLMKKTYLFIT